MKQRLKLSSKKKNKTKKTFEENQSDTQEELSFGQDKKDVFVLNPSDVMHQIPSLRIIPKN